MRYGQLADRRLGLEERLERDGGGPLAAQDELCRRLIDAGVERVVEMAGLQKIRDTVDGLVIDQDRAEKGLFRLKIMRRLAENWRLRARAGENQCRAHAPTLLQTRVADSHEVCGQRGQRALAHKESG